MKWESFQYEEALDLFEKGFILAPTATHAVLAYHTAVAAQKAFARAAGNFQKAMALHPHNKRLSYLLIDLFINLSNYDEAMQEIETAMVAYGVEEGILPAALKIRNHLGPLDIEACYEKGSTVSLCMIVKNEAQHLAACLGSAKPVVDEMIVVDTGSTDKTKDIARAFGAKVYDFNWVEDFAEARNFSISKSHGDWVFILDADEVISPLDYDRFRALVRKAINGAVAYSIETRNYTFLANMVGWTANNGHYRDEEAGTGWIPSIKVRLFPNRKDVRFVYPVHEMVDPCLKRIGIRIEACDIPIHHYGKLNPEKLDNKGETYFQIGIKKLDEMGDNIVALRELAIQAGNLEKWTEAIRLWQRFLHCKPNFPEAFVNIGTACWQLGKYEEALTWAAKAVVLQPGLKEAHFNVGINHLYLGDASQAVAVLEKLLEQHPNYLAARFMLTAAHGCAGNKRAALAGCRHIQQTDIGPVLAVSFYDVANRLAAADAIGYAVALLETAIECQSANEDIRKLLSHCLQKMGESSQVPG
ncbi:glycosyl transferase, family 2 [Olavius algarvensis Delta 1 endosymbiont]|nr:glycosyl transferase, family 2 [Olavius algarvensis Delta 1 endosymbiont]